MDNKGREILAFGDTIDHRKNGKAVSKEEGFKTLSNGQKKYNLTTKGYQALVEWLDETTT